MLRMCIRIAPRFPPFLLYVRWKSGVTFVRRCFRDDKQCTYLYASAIASESGWTSFIVLTFFISIIYGGLAHFYVYSERSSNSRSEFASSLYGRKQVTFLYSLQLKFLRMPHHRNFRHFNACVVHIFVLLKMKTVAILFLPTDMIHVDKSGMYLRQKQPITFPENCVRRVD